MQTPEADERDRQVEEFRRTASECRRAFLFSCVAVGLAIAALVFNVAKLALRM